MVKPKIISIFAGGGGSSHGYKLAGFKELLAIDFDENACNTLKANFKFPVWCKNIINVKAKEILNFCKIKEGELDILDGSPPCQGFSTVGKRDINHPKNDLFLHYVRLIKGIKPKVFIMENVSGMIKGKYKSKFNQILGHLKKTNYNVKCKLMNAMWYGVPQSRERLIFIGVRKDLNKNPSYPVPCNKIITIREALKGLGNKQWPKINHIWIDESPSGRNTKTYPLALKAKQGQKYAGFIKKLSYDKPCSTILASATIKKSYLRNSDCHPIYPRALSILEAALCSSFPKDYKWINGLESIVQIGNSVSPKMMYHIAKTIKDEILNK